MPYITHDIEGTVIGEYVAATRFKNDFLANWPRRVVTDSLGNNVEVFDDLTVYNGSVIRSASRTNLYKLLGITYQELDNGKYDGIDRTWYELSRYQIHTSKFDFTSNDVFQMYTAFPSEETTLFITYYADSVTYNESNVSGDVLVKTNGELLAEFDEVLQNPIEMAQKIRYASDPTYPSFLPLLDFNSELFTSTYRVMSVAPVSAGSTFSDRVAVHIEMKVKKIPNLTALDVVNYSDVVLDTYLTTMYNYLSVLPEGVSFLLNDYILRASSTYQELNYWYNVYNPLTETNLTIPRGDGKTWLRVDGMQDLKPQDFGKVVGKAFKSEYKIKDTEWWEDLLVIIFVVVVIVLAFFFNPALVFSIGSLVGQLVSYVAASQGHYALAANMGQVSTYMGYAAMLSAGFDFMTMVEATSLTSAIAYTATSGLAASVTASTVASFTMQWSQILFSAYAGQETAKTESELQELQQKRDEIQEQMDELPTEKKFALEMAYADGYRFCEVLEALDGMVYNMVEGPIHGATRKYFDNSLYGYTS